MFILRRGRLAGGAALLALLVSCLALTASGCAYGPSPQGPKPLHDYAADRVPLIPRTTFFDNPEKAAVQLSPDGSQLSFLAPVAGVLNVWVGPTTDPALARAVTFDAKRGIRQYFWAFDNAHILYLQDENGDENWRIYSVDVKTTSAKDLTPLKGVQAQVEEVSPKFPDEILVGLNDRDPQLHDVYRVNIRTGARQMLLQNPGFAYVVTDDDFHVRFAGRLTPDGGSELLRATVDGKWAPFLKIGPDDMLTTNPAGFDKTNKLLYLLDSRNRNTAALCALNPDTGEEKVLAEDPQADIDGALVHPTEKTIQAAASNYERKRWQVLDPAIAGDLAYLRSVADGDVDVTARTLDDKWWIAVYVVDDGPVHYYLYDHAAKKARYLFANRRELEKKPLAKMHPVVIPARDGLPLVSYLTLPRDAGPEGSIVPYAPLPLVLFVHGGPWARSSWGYSPFPQWLANRGYAVLEVNYRGSTGFGKKFINAGNKEWAGKMHDDLVDAVQWAIKNAVAAPAKVAIFGGSYGGYATLVGLTFTPDLFACGVDLVGPSNLVTLIESVPPYWKPELDLFYTRVGDPRTEEGRRFLLSRSPLTLADRIKKPLLIGQGANDPRVKRAEADQIVKAMKDKNIPVTYLLYPDEGHGFARPENWLSFNAVAETFLAANLGGRVEAIGNDFAGSSVQVLDGRDRIPGLPPPAPPAANQPAK
jgi:dipeptidyl aminopeptidase/acylaminoacyl peptidase